MTAKLEAKLGELVAEAEELRASVPWGHGPSSPEECIHQLAAAREAQDRCEAIVALLTRAKSQAEQLVADRQSDYDDKVGEVATGARRYANEYSTATERNAELQRLAMPELLKLRQAQRVHRQAKTAYDIVRMRWQGLDGIRRDVESIARLINLQTQLEGGRWPQVS